MKTVLSAWPSLAQRWRRYCACALIATLLSLGAWKCGWRWGALLDSAAHDVGFVLRQNSSPRAVAEELPQSRDIIIVDLRHDVPRPLLARLVRQLRLARAVALDLMLVDRAAQLSPDERPLFKDQLARWNGEDAELAGAMKQAHNVVIGSWPDRAPDGRESVHWERPSALFGRAARLEAHLGVSPDGADGVVRRLHPWQDPTPATSATDALPSLSLAVAALAQGKTPRALWPLDKGDDDLWINYLGAPPVFGYETNTIVFERALDVAAPEDFAGKLVFVGQTDYRSKDIFPTSVGEVPGLLIHAHATATLLDRSRTPRPFPLAGVALLSLGAALLLALPMALLRWTLPVFSLSALGELLALWLLVALLWARGNWIAPLSVPSLSVFLTYNLVALLEYARTRRTLGRVVGRSMVARLLEASVEPSLGGEEKVATAFFCDLRDFSAWAQTRTPQQLITDLNDYTATVVSCVEQFGGRPIDFFGDGVFVLFEGAGHARRSVEAALCVSQTLDGNNATHLRAGVALHTGTMVVGLVGHANHFKPGAVGETVNIASRVQSLSLECGFGVLLTRQTLDAWRNEPLVQGVASTCPNASLDAPTFCGARSVKGYAEPLEVFGLRPLTASTVPV